MPSAEGSERPQMAARRAEVEKQRPILHTAAHVLSREQPAAAQAERVLAGHLPLEVLLLAVGQEALCLHSCALRRTASLLWPACSE